MLGIFIPLIVTNCIVLARVEAFANKNPPVQAMFDGVFMGVGMPVSYTHLDVYKRQGQPRPDTTGYLMGGPMMGFEMPSLDAPIVKATNCIIASSPKLFPPPAPEMPCIRCGACAEVCPHELQPFELYWFARARNFGRCV